MKGRVSRKRRGASCSCARQRKRRFRDQAQAIAALHRINNKIDRRDEKPVRAYQCPACKGWFLTSRPT